MNIRFSTGTILQALKDMLIGVTLVAISGAIIVAIAFTALHFPYAVGVVYIVSMSWLLGSFIRQIRESKGK